MEDTNRRLPRFWKGLVGIRRMKYRHYGEGARLTAPERKNGDYKIGKEQKKLSEQGGFERQRSRCN